LELDFNHKNPKFENIVSKASGQVNKQVVEFDLQVLLQDSNKRKWKISLLLKYIATWSVP